ncbi:MAG: protein arginine kinase [Planctomycetes bacterium RBG_16_59_8]|nr:MAG: protein arginine kinase [Planctomycetes bacterium RBG_16_59_8]
MLTDELIRRTGEWLKGTGPDSDVVLSTRLRLARNVQPFLFPSAAPVQEKARIESHIRERLERCKLPKDRWYAAVDRLPPLDRQFLVERHLISRDHANGTGARGILAGGKESFGIMINEEDHLRIQVMRSGFEMEDAWKELNAIDDALSAEIPYAFDSQFGFLTACPTNMGTGLRISIMLHLPALVFVKQVDKVLNSLTRVNYTARGLFGEGSEATGDFYQISNQISLGKSEGEMMTEIGNIIPQIINFERSWRKKLLNDDRRKLEDRVWRAVGILKNARLIHSEETMNLLSILRLGENLKIIDSIPIHVLNELFIFTQPSHLQKIENVELRPEERDALRADYIRKRLNVV